MFEYSTSHGGQVNNLLDATSGSLPHLGPLAINNRQGLCFKGRAILVAFILTQQKHLNYCNNLLVILQAFLVA